MSSPLPSLAQSLARWRNNLIDLSRRNPLIALRPSRTAYLEIVHPEPAVLFDRLVNGEKPWNIWLPPIPEKKEPERKNGKTTAKKPASIPPAWQTEKHKPKAHEIVAAEQDRARLTLTLTNLYRRAHTDFVERGLHILHLACGVLEWRDADDEPMRSPLVLVPVELKRQSMQEPFVLAPAEEDPMLNPALAARLQQDYSFRLPELVAAEGEDLSLPAYLDQVQQAVVGLPGWSVQREAVLTLFSFFKGVMYQDLHDNASLVEGHPLVQVLAGTAAPATLPRVEVPDEKDLDAFQDPLQTFHILDADGSQRLCLEAAARGQSFVLQGPPGTGKSQTIANLIAHCLATGKKVLFVSEKMAALEVVYKRLRHVGLGDLCLELHSHKANKREVVAELARCLEEKPKLSDPPRPEDYARLKDRRDRLNRYVQALHAARPPMGRSAWSVLEELAGLHALPALPLGMALARGNNVPADERVLAEITAAQFDDMRQAMQRLAQLWHIRTNADFPWRNFKADRYNLQMRDEVLGLIDRDRGRLEKVQAAADQYAKQAGVSGPIHALLKLGELLETNPGKVPAAWFEESDFPALMNDFEHCAEQYQRLAQGRAPLTERYGPGIWSLAEGSADKLDQAWKSTRPLLAGGDDQGEQLLKTQQKLRGWAADTQQRLPHWTSDIRTIEKWLTVPLPLGAGAVLATSERADTKIDPSPHVVKLLLRLAHLCEAAHPPERGWLSDSKMLAEARQLIDKDRPVLAEHHQTRQRLMQIYTERIFELDLVRIADGFAGPYRSWLRFFNMEYRRDRRAIARRSRGEGMPPTAWEDVPKLRDLEVLRLRLESEQEKRRALLGHYDKGVQTNIDAVERATRIAVEALDLARQLGCEAMPAKLADALASGAPPEKIRAAIKRLTESFGHWQRDTQEMKTLLPMDRLPGSGEPLEEHALSVVVHYAKDLQAALNQLSALLDVGRIANPPHLSTVGRIGNPSHEPEPAPGKGTAGPPDLATLVSDLRAVEQFRVWEAGQETENQRWAARLGPLFHGVDTDWNALRKCLQWTRRVREWQESSRHTPCADAPHTECAGYSVFLEIVTGLKPPPSPRELKQALEHYLQALHGLEIRFDAPGPMLQGKKLAEHPPEVVGKRLQEMRDHVGQLAAWVDYRQLPSRFHHLGLDPFLKNLEHDPPSPEKVVEVFRKSFWTSWLEAMFQEEPILRDFRRAEHEQVQTEFQELDRTLIRQGAARVAQEHQKIEVVAAPEERDRQAALLRREAHKKTRHLPMRRLFEEIPDLLPRLKPCLLMSPLSVSQFLHPEKIRFDIVVFDEASQILPEDAVGAIYRGKQLVITGDNQQLPPTTFFQQMAEDDEETEEEPPAFESILDAFLGSGMPQRLLRWHYRSRHEALIAFSNQRFYENRLVTFPAAQAQHEGLGVKFVHVEDGVYDRGGRRDNPREAQVVVDLVLQHLQEDPSRTLGVIAFGFPQMNAIEDEIDRRLREHPELETHFKDDRLEGFFVKNLETVQGDERDVIILSVGYGPDAEGKVLLNFGPVNRAGGARRLNVAVTRARQKLIVVSSIRARDLDVGASQSAGVLHLRHYLEYAEACGTWRQVFNLPSLSGQVGNLPPQQNQDQAAASTSANDMTSALGKDVAEELKRLGYATVPQVGSSAFRVDLGVVDAAQPGKFLLGIVFDGPFYHGAATARLCPEVLDKLGWRIQRIWAPAWLMNRSEEVERLRKTLGDVPETFKKE